MPKPILIVDDCAADVVAVRQAVSEATIINSVQVVSNGVDAIDYLAGRAEYANRELYPFPTLMLLDLVMPFKSGMDVLQWIRSRPDPDLKQLGVVVMTSMGNIEEIRAAYQLGAHSFLVKPLVKEEFLNLLNGLKGIRLEPEPEGFELEFETGFFGREDFT